MYTFEKTPVPDDNITEFAAKLSKYGVSLCDYEESLKDTRYEALLVQTLTHSYEVKNEIDRITFVAIYHQINSVQVLWIKPGREQEWEICPAYTYVHPIHYVSCGQTKKVCFFGGCLYDPVNP